MGFSSYVNASSEHNLVPWITEYKDTRATVLYNLHHVASWGIEESDVAGGIKNIRGHSTPEELQTFTTCDHKVYIHYLQGMTRKESPLQFSLSSSLSLSLSSFSFFL